MNAIVWSITQSFSCYKIEQPKPDQISFVAPQSKAEESKKKYTHVPNKTSPSENATASAEP